MKPDQEPLEPEALEVARALRELEAPPVDPAFRARVTPAFARGTLTEGRFSGLAGEVDPEAERETPEAEFEDANTAPFPARVVRGPWRRVRQSALLAAAAALLVSIGLGLNAGPDWTVVDIAGDGVVKVDGRPLSVRNLEDLSRALRRGGRLETAGGGLTLRAGNELLIEVTPGSDAVLPAAPNRWFDRGAEARLAAGELRITSGSDFRGAHLGVRTPEVMVGVSGTTLAVIREPHGTCICVLEGRVQVAPHGALSRPVDRGQRRFVFNDGRSPEDAAIREVENVKLGMFRDRMTASR
ncbi:MAG: hypothetical protein HOP12_04130 [Candidatus Eisenbacteria bacterium]|uniref:FecR protein domain-containing protein n=1 Tax=Eiseniibacteriota bacterium TaxID=2212470 RepID=A0A849SFU8_UNCEI|nr:hypothetical protein [Candidatus Eisenbacteria bacterium]